MGPTDRSSDLVEAVRRIATATSLERMLEDAAHRAARVVGGRAVLIGIPAHEEHPARGLAWAASASRVDPAPVFVPFLEELTQDRSPRWATLVPPDGVEGLGGKCRALVAPIASPRRVYGCSSFFWGEHEAPESEEEAMEAAALLGATVGLAYEGAILAATTSVTEAKYRTLVEQIPAVTYYRALGTPGVADYVSPQAARMFGYTPEEIIASPELWFERLHPDDRERVVREQSTFRPDASGAPAVARYRILRRDGSVRWAENYARAVCDEAGVPRFVLGVILDVTEAQEAEEKRARSEAKIRRLVDSNVVGIVTGELEGRILEANEAFLGALGFSHDDVASGRLNWRDLTPPEWSEASGRAVEQVRATGVAEPFEQEYLRKDGARVPVLVGLVGIPGPGDECVCVVVDLTERKQLEERVRYAAKLEAIGRLAGGVAHDFNNLLAVVMSYADLALATLAPEDPLREDMGEILKAAQRGQALTSQLLAFSRRQPREARVVDVGEIVCGMGDTLRRMLGEGIDLRCRRSASGRAAVDVEQMEQLVSNLVVNARDAMPRGGSLVIETKEVVVRAPVFGRHGVIGPGAYVVLSVRDTGTGMDDATLARIFDPFFTTKERGKGTGLGLATVFGVVRQSGGAITVTSRPGKGSTFDVYFPRTNELPSELRPLEPSSQSPRGRETILVAEDDDAVRKLCASVLARQGYRVLEARSGGEAMLLCEREPGAIDLLLSDVVMPHMTGPELWERLAPLRPSTKALFMSGYTDEAVLPLDSPLLRKPFTAEALTRTVRAILDSGSAERAPSPSAVPRL